MNMLEEQLQSAGLQVVDHCERLTSYSPDLLHRSQNPLLPLQLRLELQEFSHYFSAPDASVGLVRLRATLVDVTAAGEKLVAQRVVVAQVPAPTLDAPGGVRALTAATDAAIEQLDQWLQQQPARQAP